MNTNNPVISHFTDRAERYNRSSKWVVDAELGAFIVSKVQPKDTDDLLDVACGTGQVSKSFSGLVDTITGLDITPAMFAQADEMLNQMVVSSAEDIPLPSDSYDLVVERQGIQFMDDTEATKEMVRVCRPGGRICLVQLCAVDESDKAEYHEILRLRNPARKNFYLREDLVALLKQAGCSKVELHTYTSIEDVDAWSDNGAIPESNREGIRQVYRDASPEFLERHAAKSEDGNRFVDHMLFAVVIGTK